MGVWEFVAVYFAVFVLIQLAVYRYLRSNDGGTPAWAGQPNPEAAPAEEPRQEPLADSESSSGQLCLNCGAHNQADPAYTFCWNCNSRLG